MNKKLIAGGVAALTAASTLATAVPASAAPHGYYRHGGGGGAAVAAGIAGLAIGAALASDHHAYYRPGYAYGHAYYGRPVYYGYPRCHAEWRWNPYWGEYTRVRVCY